MSAWMEGTQPRSQIVVGNVKEALKGQPEEEERERCEGMMRGVDVDFMSRLKADSR